MSKAANMSIKLSEILPIQNLSDYKLHLACWDGNDQPLDVFVRSKEEWEDWQRYREKETTSRRETGKLR